MLKDYIWKAIKNDPKYAAFAKANNLNQLEEERKSLYQDLMDYHGTRINSYNYFKDLYYNSQWYSMSSEVNPNPSVVNYPFLIVQKHNSFLMGKGFLVESEFPEVERFLRSTWEKNNIGKQQTNKLGFEIGLSGGVTGDSFLWYYWDVDDVGEVYLKIELLDSSKCFPVYEDGIMKGFLYYGEKNKVVNLNHGFASYASTYAGKFFGKGYVEKIEDEKVVDNVSLLSNDIPIIHIKNMPTLMDYGISDLAPVDKIILNYNSVLNEIHKIVKYHASPVTVITGAKVENLIRGVNRVWGIPNKDARITNLSLEGDLAAINKHLEKLKESISELSNIPESTLGKLTNISNTSGAAIAITFMPLFEVMEMKRVQYGTKFLELNKRLIREAILLGKIDINSVIRNAITKWKQETKGMSDEMKNKFYPFSKKVSLTYDYSSFEAFYSKKIPEEIFETFITWYPPLPRDEKIMLDMSVSAVSSGIWSRKHARKKMGMTEKEALLMEEEVIKEADKVITITNSSKINNAIKGSPDVVSENNSINQE